MKKSEELMLLLNYNKINVSAYHLRKQLSFESTHPNTLLFHLSLEDLFRLEYGKKIANYYLLQNPLMYHNTWPKEIKSIGQFYVQTKDSNRVVSIDEIVQHPAYKGAGLKRILQDIFVKYIEEYNVAFLTMLKRLQKMYFLLPKTEIHIIKMFRKKFVISLIFFLSILGIFFLPSQSIFAHSIVQEVVDLLFESSSLSATVLLMIGRFILLLCMVFFMMYYGFKSRLKEVQEMQIVHRNFNEDNVIEEHQNHLEKTMLNIQLYIEKIDHENAEKFPLLKTLSYEQKDLQNYINKLAKTHKKNDVLQHQKSYYISVLNIVFYLAVFFSSIFFISIIIQVVFGVIFDV